MPTSFVNRGFEVNDSTHSNFNTGWATILESIHQNHPVIVLMWFSSLKRYGHYVVIIGYNQTGLFIHDPWPDSAVDRECGSNVYLSKYLFEILWEYDEYWSMIIPYQPGLTLKAEVDPEYTSLDIITLNVTAYNNGQRLMGSDVIAYATIRSNGHYILDFEEVLTLLDDGKGNYLGKYQIQHGDLNGLEEEWEIYINMIFDDFVGGIKTTTKVTYSPIPMIVIGCVIVIVLSVLVLSILWIRRRRIPYQN